MAFQTGSNPKAGAPMDPTKKIGRPAGETYKSPKLDRGSVVLDRADAGPRSNYGRGQSAIASSVGVEQSAHVMDFDASPSDAARDALISRGISKQDNEFNTQTRSLDPKGNVPDAFGMASARTRQNSTHSAMAAKVTNSITPNPGDYKDRKPGG